MQLKPHQQDQDSIVIRTVYSIFYTRIDTVIRHYYDDYMIIVALLTQQQSPIRSPRARVESVRNLDHAIDGQFPRRNVPLVQPSPNFGDVGALGREHAILQAVHVLAVDGRHELPGREVEDDTRREVVLSKTGA